MNTEDFAALLADATAEAERAGSEAEPTPEPKAEPDAVSEPITPEPDAAEPVATNPVESEPKPSDPQTDHEQEPWYKKRIDTLTERRNREQQAREAAEARVKTLEAMLAAGSAPADGAPPTDTPAAPGAPSPRVFTQEEVQKEAARIAAADAFNRQCNTVFDEGVKAYGNDFQKAVGNLNTAGLITDEDPTFLRAIMDTDAPALLLNHLGKDPAQAERLLSMSPFKMGAELARMADRLAKPAAPAPLSKAPAPIDPIGAARPKDQVNLADENTPDGDFFAEFEKQLSRRS